MLGEGSNGSGASFENMTQGVSVAGINAIYERIHTSIVTEASEALINNLPAVEAALRQGWSGTDCEAFLGNLRSLATNIGEQLVDHDKSISECFVKLAEDWAAFQAKNVTSK